MSLGDWVEGREKNGVNKGGSRDKGLIKSPQFCVRALNDHVRAIKAFELRLLTFHIRNILDFA